MIVLDSSAILAFLLKETGAQMVQEQLAAAVVCSVNATEVITKLIDEKWDVQTAIMTFDALGVHVLPYDKPLSIRAGALRQSTKHRGLSLGDRACLALAERERMPVLTADRVWTALDIGVDIRLAR